MDFSLTLAFFFVAALYSSVGFGGGSTYLALLSLFSKEAALIKPLGLACNLLVTGGNLTVFLKQGIYSLFKFWPFLLISLPFSFWGGTLRWEDSLYLKILGFSLLLTSGALVLPTQSISRSSRIFAYPKLLLSVVSALFGFLSGVVGIGGGVFLAPVLHLLRWDSGRTIAGISSLYIFTNSLAGLWGQSFVTDWFPLLIQHRSLLGAVLLGSAAGNLISWRWFRSSHLKLGTALLLLLIALRLIFA
jgi:uncharacterized protein